MAKLRRFNSFAKPEYLLAAGLLVLLALNIVIGISIWAWQGVSDFIQFLPLGFLNMTGYFMLITPVSRAPVQQEKNQPFFWWLSLFVWLVFGFVLLIGSLFGMPIGLEPLFWMIVGFAVCQLIKIVFWKNPTRWFVYYGLACMMYAGVGTYLVSAGLI